MSVILILLIEIAAAVAFFILWAEDRSRRYLLWWGVAHLALPAAYGTGWLSQHLELLGAVPTMLLYSGCMSVVIVSFLKGGVYFRVGQRYQSLLDRAGLSLVLVLMVLYFYSGDIHPPASLIALALMGSYGLIAVLLWRGGDRLEKSQQYFLCCGRWLSPTWYFCRAP